MRSRSDTLRWLSAAALLAGLIAGWIYLYVNSHSVTLEHQTDVLGQLRDLKQLDARWFADVLRCHADVNHDYDPLVAPLQTFDETFARLDREAAVLGDPEVTARFAEMRASFEAKAGLVDAFKMGNSLYKNSLRYVPTAADEIQARMRGERERRSNGTGGGARLVLGMAEVRGAVDEALRYSSVPDPEAARALATAIESLRGHVLDYPEFAREPIENLLMHMEVILRLRVRQVELLGEIARVPFMDRIDAFSASLTRRFEMELARQFRHQRWLLAYSALALVVVFGVVAILAYRSATERRRLHALVEKQTRALKENEAQLVHAQKMQALGEMVAGITHEVNTPLAAVRSGLESSRELVQEIFSFVPADEQAEAAESFEMLGGLVEDSLLAVRHIHSVVVNMLNFSRLDREGMTTTTIEESVGAVLAMAGHFLKGIDVATEYASTPPIAIDAAQIHQVVLNVLRNAAQAVPSGRGKIRIATDLDERAEQVVLRIADNGPGIAPELLPKIWEPFFTTKRAAAGTGLGLSTSRRIAETHGGSLDVESTGASGTVFVLRLPVARTRKEAA